MRRYLAAILFSAAFIINIITCLVLWYYASGAQQPIPLHYNVISGFDELGSRAALYQIPLFAFIVWVLNLVLTVMLRGLGKYVGALSGAVAFFVAIILLISSVLLKLQGS